MIVTVPAATRSVRIWARGDSTVIEVDGLAEHSAVGTLFGMEAWQAVEAPAPRRRFRIAPVAGVGVVLAAFLVAVGIRVMSSSGQPADDAAQLRAGPVEYAQPSAAPMPEAQPSFAQEIAQPAQPAPVPPRRAATGPNAAFGLD